MNAVPRVQVEAFYLPRDEHSLFCLLFSPPAGTPSAGAVVHVPAFAEEMNKSRRAVANAARDLAERGWHVLVFDLHGTGDSSGDLGDASWAGWLKDIHAAVGWLRTRTETEPALWGLRTGCLLINDALEQLKPSQLIFWQPVLSGEAALTQFLRLRSVGTVGNEERPKETAKGLLASLQSGTTLEVAGYMLPPALALPLRQSRLGSAGYAGARIIWMEVSSLDPPDCGPASRPRIEELTNSGALVAASAVPGIAFWMTQEIDEAGELVRATVAGMS